ncbi:MAG: hypothetical protein R2867_36185 [Caldilineaceae bacterium]
MQLVPAVTGTGFTFSEQLQFAPQPKMEKHNDFSVAKSLGFTFEAEPYTVVCRLQNGQMEYNHAGLCLRRIPLAYKRYWRR